MAIEINWTGFEGGNSDQNQAEPFRGAVIGDGTARTGDFYCKHITGSTGQSNTGQEFRQKDLTIGTGLADGEKAKTVLRVWIRLKEHVGTDNCRVCSKGNTGQRADLALKTDGKFVAVASATFGVVSTQALALNTWYRVDFTYTNTQGTPGNCVIDVSISIYNEDGSLLETVTSSAAVAANTSAPTGTFVSNSTTAVTSTYHFDFDDWFWIAADKTDISSAVLPSATRITRVTANAQGSSAQWTGDFRTTTDIPRESTITDEQSTSGNGNTTTLDHPTATALMLGTIRGVSVKAYMKASGGAGTDALMWNGVEYSVSTPTVYGLPVLNGVDYNPYSASSFDAAEFGARNKRGVAIQLGNCWLEVLHDGSDPTRSPFMIGVASWKHKTGKYTGNGTYQTISGVGFGANCLIIKPINSGANTYGVLKLAKMGGTYSRKWSGVLDTIAILEITSDGFKLGPSTGVNASGIEYEYIAIQDGGAHSSGYFLAVGGYVGNATDNRNIVLPENIEPDIVITDGASGMYWRTDDMVGDFSLLLDTVGVNTDHIQALNVDGFQVGAGQPNAVNSVYHYFAIRLASQLQLLIARGKVTPSGTTFTVTGVAFAPEFALALRSNAGSRPYWRANAAHSGSNSSPWALNGVGNGNNVTTGVTAMTGDGFSGGSDISSAGIDTFWMALFGSGSVSAAPDYTGIYKVVANKRNDTLYDRSVTPATTVNNKIPNPFAKLAYLGEE